MDKTSFILSKSTPSYFLYASTHMKNILTSAYFNRLIKLIFYVVFWRLRVFVCLRYNHMKSKFIHIRMEVKYFDCNNRSVFHIFQLFGLPSFPLIIYYNIELKLVSS